jgi:broad specificity phosphatase PhoE
MKIYFVRHGTTDSFDRQVCQPASESLNSTGLDQVRKLANYFSKSNIDLVISSKLKRAIQTAEAVSKEKKLSSLFNETTHPSEIIGLSRTQEPAKSIINMINEKSLVDPEWHYSDEENFIDLRKRGLKAIEYLVSKKEETILVVSHGNFIRLLTGIILFGNNLSINDYVKLLKILRLDNTGVSIFSYDQDSKRWYLQCWNNTSHLAET